VKFNFWTVFSLITVLSAWLAKSTEDGKITLDEVIELVFTIAQQLGLSMDQELIDLKKI